MIDKIIEECSKYPYIKWNDDSLLDLIRNDNVYNVYIILSKV